MSCYDYSKNELPENLECKPIAMHNKYSTVYYNAKTSKVYDEFDNYLGKGEMKDGTLSVIINHKKTNR